jgi:hypothetical protein
MSKTPSMGDVDPSPTSVDAFAQKQREFREQLVEAQRQREARALAARKAKEAAQDSLATDAERTAKHTEQENGRKNGPLTNLIYGTKEGREMEAQIEASFSQILARGKYVHSIVFHEVKPDKVDEYVELVGNWYPKMANDPANRVHLVGSWRTEVGDCDTFGQSIPFRSRLPALEVADHFECSPHLGIPKVRRVPRISALHFQPPRVWRIRQQVEALDQF